MNSLKSWVTRSREAERRAPERYIRYYPELVEDGEYVLMSVELYEKIERNCGRYDGTFPTGAYLGKMFMRGPCLYWYGIDKERAMTNYRLNSRKIIVIS